MFDRIGKHQIFLIGDFSVHILVEGVFGAGAGAHVEVDFRSTVSMRAKQDWN